MKKLFYIFIILFFFILFEGCRTKKEIIKEKDSIVVDSSKWAKNDSINKIVIKQLQEKITTIRDSLMNVQLAYEKSQNKLSEFLAKKDTSRVETSLAFSLAWIEVESGILNHTIENKKQALLNIPVITEKEKSEKDSTNVTQIVNKDSTNISSNQNSISENTKIIEIKSTFKEKMVYVGIGILIGIILALVIKVLILKFKK